MRTVKTACQAGGAYTIRAGQAISGAWVSFLSWPATKGRHNPLCSREPARAEGSSPQHTLQIRAKAHTQIMNKRIMPQNEGRLWEQMQKLNGWVGDEEETSSWNKPSSNPLPGTPSSYNLPSPQCLSAARSHPHPPRALRDQQEQHTAASG